MARLFTAASSDKLVHAAAVKSTLPFTMAAWFRSTDLSLDQTILGIERGSIGTSRYQLKVAGNSSVDRLQTLHRDDAAGFAISETSATPTVNVWAHAVGVFASSSSRPVYLNGVAGTNDTTSLGTTTVNQTSIGTCATATPFEFFNGDIAEAAIWSVALTAAEALILSKGYSPLLVRPESLLAYWPLIGRNSPETSLKGPYEMTVTGTSTSVHPKIMYPHRRNSMFTAAAAGGVTDFGLSGIMQGEVHGGGGFLNQGLHNIPSGINA